jgi:hypothetical protein
MGSNGAVMTGPTGDEPERGTNNNERTMMNQMTTRQ